ncbi:IclR family transcriptional regulator [Lacticaseibacillus saniviri]|uniref:IclR family transcriptional regulator n=1 Tax=Lacticaseibacillus saniviri JCM 17471 = DSM 24301 TaxID=1293598 RepID=A0A0R2MUL3_9LACO|nr:IclR family transcriptional regulator [Lacticaseibacillus saniviri]KRO17311.1 IclR family transcriptional regulator [Lacticaseibacillus saniviri JCM 17471 = DSM 24301]MCG4282670.1 IclR family transcriptional regulator [Lacticaseibacillus saniviri]
MADQKLYGTVLVKAKEILDFILSSTRPPTLLEISAGIDLSKPTVLKILNTLTVLDFVRRDDDTKRYYLGTQLLTYADKALKGFDIRSVALPNLGELRDRTEETINLGVLANNRIALIDKLESSSSIKLKSVIGGTMNMYSSAMGKALLAQYSPNQLDQYLAETELKPLTSHTIINQTALRTNLKQIQQIGVSIDDEENEPEVFCIGAPLMKNNQIYGAFSVSAPKYRINAERRTELIRLVLNAQREIEQRI